jgi:hypothetical protein
LLAIFTWSGQRNNFVEICPQTKDAFGQKPIAGTPGSYDWWYVFVGGSPAGDSRIYRYSQNHRFNLAISP